MTPPQPNAFPPDSIENTIMGVHMGVPKTLLTRQHVAASVNLTHRGGRPTTRPPIVKRELKFAADDSDVNSTEALFQGAAFYEGFGNQKSALIASIGGRIFRYDVGVSSLKVQDVSVTGNLNSPVAPQVWMFQGEDFLIINDGLANPIFFDGSGSRRSAGPEGEELPPGTVGTYANGRIVMALTDRRSFIAGDLVYSNGNFGGYGGRDAILKTKENKAVLGGAAFAVPINAGRINAMFTVAVPDTTLGQSALQIGTRKAIFGINLPLDSSEWGNLQQPTSVVSLPNSGPLSQNSVAIINSDAWYRATDGIRSFQVGRRDLGTWVQTPLSSEVEPLIKHDTEHLLEFASATHFNNRLLMTCSPYRVSGRGVAHRGLIALDFNNVSGLTVKASPNYDGVWTGLPILQIVEGNFEGQERCFLFALDLDNKICLYEVLKDGAEVHDFDGEDEVPIECWLASGALYGLEIHDNRLRNAFKKLMTSDIFLEELQGTVELDVKYRSDSYPCWVDWKAFSLCATDCVNPADCSQPRPTQPLYATYRRLPDPADDCNPITGRLHRTGYHFQIRLQWTGRAALDKMMLWCVPKETMPPGCPTNEACKTLQCCGDDYFTYSIEDNEDDDDDGGGGDPDDPDDPEECAMSFVLQPQSQQLDLGEDLVLSVTLQDNIGLVTVQWYFNGVALSDSVIGGISGATTGELTIENVTEANAGIYYAIVIDTGDGNCELRSTNATIDVTPAEIPYGGPPPPEACVYTLTEIESEYVIYAGPSVNPNELMAGYINESVALFLNERALYIANYLSDQVISSIGSFYWSFGSGTGSRKLLGTKVASGVSDPENPDGDVLAVGSSYWRLVQGICHYTDGSVTAP